MPNTPPALDFALGETADAIRAATVRFATDKIAPHAAQIDETDAFPRPANVVRSPTLGVAPGRSARASAGLL